MERPPLSRREAARRALAALTVVPVALNAQTPAQPAETELQEAERAVQRSVEAVMNVSVKREVAPALRFKA